MGSAEPVADRLAVLERATSAPLGSVAAQTPEGVAAVVAEAAKVQPLWAALRVGDRARYLRRAAQAVIDEYDELVAILAREQGRPGAEIAVTELLPAVEALRQTAQTGPRLLGSRRVAVQRAMFPLKRAHVAYEPRGVVAVIAAHGGPFAQPLAQIAQALLGGDAVVLKPAPGARLAAERIARLLARAGLPEGLVRVVHGGAQVGAALTRAPVSAVLFAGSREHGREVAAACAAEGRPAVLELRASNPALVLADATLSRAVAGTAWASFAAAGQARGSVKRIYVAAALAERFVAELVEHVRALRVGDPVAAGTQIGPLRSVERQRHVTEAVRAAVDAGATLRCGGAVERPGGPEALFAPAVLTGATPEMELGRSPVVGPVVVVTAVDSAAEAIELANAGGPALAASVWTADRYRGARVSRELTCGAVWLNDHLITPAVPQAGWGAPPGAGPEGALAAATRAQVRSWDPPGGREPWWFPYDPALERAVRAFVELASGRDADRQRGLRDGALPLARMARRAVGRSRG
jgi:acyl-CoA reductase-like NAD-dependent aldehyde dehydrogenase